MLTVYMQISLASFILTPIFSGKYYTHFTVEETGAQLGLEWIPSNLWIPYCVCSRLGIQRYSPSTFTFPTPCTISELKILSSWFSDCLSLCVGLAWESRGQCLGWWEFHGEWGWIHRRGWEAVLKIFFIEFESKPVALEDPLPRSNFLCFVWGGDYS